jgi:CheY-like chemotaxis protein
MSSPNGHLSVQWEMQTSCGCRLVLEWRESGGPKVSAPQGRGFGTALIEQTVSARGGEISIRYGAGGVTCRIILPVPESDRQIIGLQLATPKNGKALSLLSCPNKDRSLQGKCIIIIEDEPLVAMDLESILTAAGCEVVGSAGTLNRARALIADAESDAALLDVNLCGHRVDELATALTQKNIPFAFITGYGRESLPSGFREAILLKKPFSQEQLVGMVELLLYQAVSVARLRPKTV